MNLLADHDLVSRDEMLRSDQIPLSVLTTIAHNGGYVCIRHPQYGTRKVRWSSVADV